jgi:hypothetical protein
VKRSPRPQPIVRYVYVIGPTRGFQKIGIATNPQSRLAALQTASPVDLLIHAAIAVPFRAAPDVEHQAHRLLGRMCVRSEWFEATPAEALFAVYTAALPWMEKLTIWRPVEPLIASVSASTSTPLPPALPRVEARIAGWAPELALPADPLPLFRPRSRSLVGKREAALWEPGV